MSDIRPLPPLPDVNDPTATQVLVRTIGGSTDFRTLGAQATSCSIIVVDGETVRDRVNAHAPGGTADSAFVDRGVTADVDVENPIIDQILEERDGVFSRVRPEVLVVGTVDRASTRSPGVVPGGRPYRLRFHAAPDDRYCSALIEGVEQAANEFIVIPRQGSEPLIGLSAVLGHMWVDGADMAVIPAVLPMSQGVPVGDEVITTLPRWLGLEDCRDPSATIVMRRWFAKWVFNEIHTLPDPVEELADRIRLLGSTILVMKWIDA